MLSDSSIEVGDAMLSTKWNVSCQVLGVEVSGGGTLVVRWSDGTLREYDPRPLIAAGSDYFSRLDDPGYFKQARVSEFGDTVEWPDGQDIAPEDLYEQSRILTET